MNNELIDEVPQMNNEQLIDEIEIEGIGEAINDIDADMIENERMRLLWGEARAAMKAILEELALI